MKGILILAHGSREKSTENTLIEVVNILKQQISDYIIEVAFLQFAETNLQAGLNKLVSQGITNIKVIPYFLFDGVHIREDIPAEIKEYITANPNVKISFGKTLGADHRLAEILADRIKETL